MDLKVIARRQGELPIVAVNLWYHVGSKDEERSVSAGSPHLFEHLMFEGSEHYPGRLLQAAPAARSLDQRVNLVGPNQLLRRPANVAHMELALAMESDRMGHFLPTLTDEKIRVQKDVVKNEYRQQYANRPYGQAWRMMAEAMYPPRPSL